MYSNLTSVESDSSEAKTGDPRKMRRLTPRRCSSPPAYLVVVILILGATASELACARKTANFNIGSPAAALRSSRGKRRSIDMTVPSTVRGGSSNPNYYDPSNVPDRDDNRNKPEAPPSASYYDSASRATYSSYEPPPEATTDDDPFHETVQERVDQWRSQLQENAAKLQESPRDEKGRMKLLTSVGKGSRALVFFVIMWRDVSLYEWASDLKFGSVLVTTPIMTLFLCNMVGAAVSLRTSPSHATKKRLKAILNLDKLVEMVLILWYLLRLTIVPAKYVAREVYIGRLLHAIFFLFQMQAFTRLSWDDNAAQPMSSYNIQQRQQQQQSYPPSAARMTQQQVDPAEDWHEYQRQQQQLKNRRF